jgi:hypothetical protein
VSDNYYFKIISMGQVEEFSIGDTFLPDVSSADCKNAPQAGVEERK